MLILIFIPSLLFSYLGEEREGDILNRFDILAKVGSSISWNLLDNGQSGNMASVKGYPFVSGGAGASFWIFDVDIVEGFSLDFFVDMSFFFLRKGYKESIDKPYFWDPSIMLRANAYINADYMDIPATFKTYYHFGQIAQDIPVVEDMAISFSTGVLTSILMTSNVEVDLYEPAYLSDQINGEYSTATSMDRATVAWIFALGLEYDLPFKYTGEITLDIMFNLGMVPSFHTYETSQFTISQGNPSNLYVGLGYQMNLGELINFFN